MRKNLERAIRLNPKVPPCHGFVRNRKGCYSTVAFALRYTDFLINSAEGHRRSAGLEPLICWDDEMEEYMIDGSYDFHLEMNDRPGNRVEIIIRYVTESDMGGDAEDGKARSIRLTREEQDTLLKQLDMQSRQHFGKTCEELLEEARNKWRSEIEGHQTERR